jgi:hypothetical protein
MRNLIFTLLLFGLAHTWAGAQPNGDRLRERVRAQRVAIFTEVLKLTPTEAEGFWPVYNQFLDDREAVNQQMRALRTENLSDKEAEEQVKKHLELLQREVDLEKDLVQRLRKVISMQKIARIPDAERQFRKTVLDKVKERRDERRGGR